MKKLILGCILILSSAIPSIALAKAPLFFNTGDELFEIEGAPNFDDGYSVGYVCKRFGVFGADIWTWDCKLMAINISDFAAGELPAEMKSELSQKYSLSDRKRSPWNQYGIWGMLALVLAYSVLKLRKA